MRSLAAIIVVFTSALAVACDGASSPISPPPSPPVAAASPISPPVLDATAIIGVSGLFNAPSDTKVDEHRSLGPRPQTFAPWDGVSTMLYDVIAGTEMNLGPGTLGRFSPDGTKMAWIADPQPPFANGEAWLIEIATGAKRDLGPGWLTDFVDNDHVGVTRSMPAGSETSLSESIDLHDGSRSLLPGCFAYGCHSRPLTEDGYFLSAQAKDGGYATSLIDPASNTVLLRFASVAAASAGRGTIAIATAPKITATAAGNGYGSGTTNVFLIDIRSGRATFVATGAYAEPNWPLTANEHYVVWTENYCGSPQGRTRIFVRATGKVIELDATLWPSLTPVGLIRDGPFGGDSLIDPATLRYVAAIPARGDTSWSADYRYASLGQFGGHGGPCP